MLSSDVRGFLAKLKLSEKEGAFLQIGVYTAEDLLTLALASHDDAKRALIRTALELEGIPWLSMQSALKAYACPVERPESE